MVAVAELSEVPLGELIPVVNVIGILPPNADGSKPCMGSIYNAVKRGEIPVVRHRGRMHTHPKWITEAAMVSTTAGPMSLTVSTPKRKQQQDAAEKKADALGL